MKDIYTAVILEEYAVHCSVQCTCKMYIEHFNDNVRVHAAD